MKRVRYAFLAGAPKAGSSALSYFLSQHPQISGSVPKELNFHARDLDLPRPASLEDYARHFPAKPDARICLDGSILSLCSSVAASEIARHHGDALVLIVLRDPVAAMESWHRQLVFTGNEPLLSFEEALAAEPDRRAGRRVPKVGTAARCPRLLWYRDMMRYGEQVERFCSRFPPERLLVLLHDDLRAEPTGCYRRLEEFLGVEPGFQPVFSERNPSRVRRSALLHVVMKRALARPARAMLSVRVRFHLSRWLDRINSRTADPPPSLSASLRDRLREELFPDVVRLSDRIGQDMVARWWGAAPLPERSSAC